MVRYHRLPISMFGRLARHPACYTQPYPRRLLNVLNLLRNVSRFALPWRGRMLYAALIPLLGSVSPSLYATISQVQLGTSPAAPQLLGTTVHLTASAMDTDPGP